MTMIERVARAFCRAEGDEEDWVNWVTGSRAAIEAMREPTPVMMDAINENAGTIAPEYAWYAGIDAALAEEA